MWMRMQMQMQMLARLLSVQTVTLPDFSIPLCQAGARCVHTIFAAAPQHNSTHLAGRLLSFVFRAAPWEARLHLSEYSRRRNVLLCVRSGTCSEAPVRTYMNRTRRLNPAALLSAGAPLRSRSRGNRRWRPRSSHLIRPD